MSHFLQELLLFLVFGVAALAITTLCFVQLKSLSSKYIGTFVGVAVALLVYQASSCLNWLPVLLWLILIFKAAVIFVPQLRIGLFMMPMLKYFRAVLPPMSDTEREALEAGTVWWEPEIFGGRPDWNKLVEAPVAQLTEEEQAFIDGPTEELCQMIDDWAVSAEDYDLSEEVWKFMRKRGFFGMIIPKSYGGLEFSAFGHSCVVMKIASRSCAAGVTVMVPNSLGPGQLLHEYGTKEQQDHYLPRLADGRETPCFALTEPTAGSDAAGMLSNGVVIKKKVKGKEVIGIKLNWNKRYITLAPVATVLGLAFKLYDPDHLIGDKDEVGITLALIPTSTRGVSIGDRHMPLNTPFMNGPIHGKNVFITMDHIIGGVEQVGQGWRMLMECLSDGRGISLPTTSVAAAKFSSMHTGAYARVRNQFNLSIAEFEGVKEALACISGNTYLMDAVRRFSAATIDMGERPSVGSAIAKYHLTERMRDVVDAAMDVHGGSAICMGPRNPIGRTYMAVPVSVTVEGANILTRSLIIFGQGSVRSHPWILKSMEAAAETDDAIALPAFDEAISNHVTMFASNLSKSVLAGFSESLFTDGLAGSPASKHYRKLSHLSASFAVIADILMLRYGGELKRLEYYSCLLGDMLSYLYIGSAVLKHYHARGETTEDMPLLEWSMEECYRGFHNAMVDILDNKPMGPLTGVIKRVIYPLGVPARSRNRKLEGQVADIITENSHLRRAMIEDIFMPTDENDPVAKMQDAFHAVLEATTAEKRFKKVVKGLEADDIHFDECLKEALEKELISEGDAALIKRAHFARMDVIQVDDFDHDHWKKTTKASEAV